MVSQKEGFVRIPPSFAGCTGSDPAQLGVPNGENACTTSKYISLCAGPLSPDLDVLWIDFSVLIRRSTTPLSWMFRIEPHPQNTPKKWQWCCPRGPYLLCILWCGGSCPILFVCSKPRVTRLHAWPRRDARSWRRIRSRGISSILTTVLWATPGRRGTDSAR